MLLDERLADMEQVEHMQPDQDSFLDESTNLDGVVEGNAEGMAPFARTEVDYDRKAVAEAAVKYA